MCDTITVVAQHGHESKEIETIGQFERHFGVRAIRYGGYDEVYENGCLCPIDISATLKQHRVAYIQDPARYFVGPVEWLRARVDKYTMNIYIP